MKLIGLHSLCLLIALLISTKTAFGFEPFTIGALSAIGAASPLAYRFGKQHTYCRVYECCDERSIPADIEALRKSLAQSLYGQHIVAQHIVSALQAHFSKQSSSRKPLVISFHGQPGTGKNFVADQIAQALYFYGVKSQYVRKFMGRADFPRADQVDRYKELITTEVRSRISSCPNSLFIFDEVDKMPSGVFDALTSLVDYNAFPDGTDNTKAIFIFLSNTAGVTISNHLGELMKGGRSREDTRLTDFEPLLQKDAYNQNGGLKKTSLIEAFVIDHYMPFLPMEKAHVVKCLEAEFRRWNRSPDRKIIDNIIASSITYDRTHGLFAVSGCKTLEKKVAMAIN